MAILNDEQVAALSIERMIFHVVTPEDLNPTFLSEVRPPQCEEFFLERIKETLKGAAYLFATGAGTEALIRPMLSPEAQSSAFVEASRGLATRFKEKVRQDRRMLPGVLMLFLLSSGDKKICSVIKYDHQEVVKYAYKRDDNGELIHDYRGLPMVDLESFVNAFTKDKKAMQKSAVISLDDVSGGEVVVIDHSSGKYRDASKHFTDFLDIRRKLTREEMLERLVDAAVESIKAHKDQVPAEVAKAPKQFVRTAVSRMEGFDHEQAVEFLGAVVQGISQDSPLVKTFSSKLKGCGLESESFSFRGVERPMPEYRRIVTREGIAILYNKAVEGRVSVDPAGGGGEIITIRTSGVEQKDDIEKLPRLPD